MNKRQKFIVFGLSVLMVFGILQFDSYALENNAPGSLTVNVYHSVSEWSVTGPLGKVIASGKGKGSYTKSGLKPGTYTFSWKRVGLNYQLKITGRIDPGSNLPITLY